MKKVIDSVRAALLEMAQIEERTAADCKEMVCKNCGDKFGMPTEGSCMYDSKDPNGKNWKESDDDDDDNDDDDMNEAMDPVNKKELKKDFKDRSDKDVDNDGDVDKSDEYLVKKRKAISKTVKKNEDEPEGETGETATMNPKKEDKATKESTFRDRLMSIWEDAAGEKRKAKQNQEPMHKDDEDKKMYDGHPADKKGEIGPEADDTDKAERAGPSAKARGNDNMQGDKAIINNIANAYKKLSSGKDA